MSHDSTAGPVRWHCHQVALPPSRPASARVVALQSHERWTKDIFHVGETLLRVKMCKEAIGDGLKRHRACLDSYILNLKMVTQFT